MAATTRDDRLNAISRLKGLNKFTYMKEIGLLKALAWGWERVRKMLRISEFFFFMKYGMKIHWSGKYFNYVEK